MSILRNPPNVKRPTGPRRYTYNTRLIRRTLSYSIPGIAELFTLHPNAVRRWLKAGLRVTESKKPYLIHGSDLIAFLDAKQRGRKRRCGPDEMYCCRCREPRRPVTGQTTFVRLNARQGLRKGVCELCGTRMNRSAPLKRLEALEAEYPSALAPTLLMGTADALVPCHFNEVS